MNAIRIQHIDHVVLRVVDLAAMLRFYVDVLGCTPEKNQEAIGLYQVRAGSSLIDLVPIDGKLGRAGGAAPGREGRNVDHLCLSIDPFDAAAIAAHLKSHGLTPGAIESRYGAEGEGPSIYLSDPEGNTVELKGPPGLAPPGSTKRFFPGFEGIRVTASGAVINGVIGGNGPPVLLLHGWPQSHLQWRKVTTRLAERYTVVATDLRGYGDSSKPEDGQNHDGYSKRSSARDQVEVMRQLGFERFALVGHDRGGRVSHRLALDHPDCVSKLAVLDIVPTRHLFANVTKELATAYPHWFFLLQPAPLPETLLRTSAEAFLRSLWRDLIPAAISEEVFADYLRCLRAPGAVRAMCEDYRAAASIDLDHDRSDLERKVACPLLALWASKGAMHRLFDVAETWRERALDVTGKSLPGGHWLTEELPDAVADELLAFLA